MHKVDCRGLKCPQPVINTKKYFDSIEQGKAEITVDNEVAKNNIVKLCESSGLKYEVNESQGLYHIVAVKDASEGKSKELDKKKLTILISSDKMGEGDDKLGAALMKSYLFALSEADAIPENLLFLNGGVNLTVKSSDVLESLKALEKRGVSISSCGTCLDFYQIKEELAIGDITNMYTIVEKMNAADKTIKI